MSTLSREHEKQVKAAADKSAKKKETSTK